MENKILVTGATGNIGIEVIKLLKAKNANNRYRYFFIGCLVY